jgi:hypothetical protein
MHNTRERVYIRPIHQREKSDVAETLNLLINTNFNNNYNTLVMTSRYSSEKISQNIWQRKQSKNSAGSIERYKSYASCHGN